MIETRCENIQSPPSKYSSLFLDEENHVWACGENSSGQLGVTPSHQPLTKLELPSMKSITAGWMHSVFLDEDGTPWTCGNNSQGSWDWETWKTDAMQNNKKYFSQIKIGYKAKSVLSFGHNHGQFFFMQLILNLFVKKHGKGVLI